MRTTQTSAVGVWEKAGSWLLTAALPDPGSVPKEPNDLVSCIRPVWSCIHCFYFGDRNNFKEASITRLTGSEGCTWPSCPVRSGRGRAGARSGRILQRPVTVDTSTDRLYLYTLNTALPAVSRLVPDISASIQSTPVTNTLKIHGCLALF